MFVVITDPSTGTELMRRALRDDEMLDPCVYADEYGRAIGYDLRPIPGAYSFDGDVRVELLEDPENAVHIWTGGNFYIESED